VDLAAFDDVVLLLVRADDDVAEADADADALLKAEEVVAGAETEALLEPLTTLELLDLPYMPPVGGIGYPLV